MISGGPIIFPDPSAEMSGEDPGATVLIARMTLGESPRDSAGGV